MRFSPLIADLSLIGSFAAALQTAPLNGLATALYAAGVTFVAIGGIAGLIGKSTHLRIFSGFGMLHLVPLLLLCYSNE